MADRPTTSDNPELERLSTIEDDASGWRHWGPYLSDRAWGTVREDYSSDGDAWRHLPYDAAHAKAYRWGEDGIGGICDRYQFLCLAGAFWNEADSHLKERFFGLTPHQGNHGEDVKEIWYHVDNIPSHSWMQLRYRYPQRAFPYQQLIEENQRRQGSGPEYELTETGIFDDGRWFDITFDYGKIGPEDLVLRISARNHSDVAAPLHLLPTLWFRNTWAWDGHCNPTPRLQAVAGPKGTLVIEADDAAAQLDPRLAQSARLGQRWLMLACEPADRLLFTDNETHGAVVYGPGHSSRSEFTKDAFHRYLCAGETTAINPAAQGTKACMHAMRMVPAGATVSLHLLLSDQPPSAHLNDGMELVDLVEKTLAQRREEADRFYAALHPPAASADERHVQRRALAGLLWSKQNYIFDVNAWLDGDNPACPPLACRQTIRNHHWRHLNSLRVMSMPDTWEYPWFAAWDLAFHCIPLALVDPRFAKDQLWLLLFEQFQHPNGQLPAYEWEFSDLNPPVHAWAVWRVFNMEKRLHGSADRSWLERCFHKLLLVFTSWVNRVDPDGNNVFEGGFLGLDNISVYDRSEMGVTGASLKQSDATGWMGHFSLTMMRIALELAHDNPAYEALATKFLQHYVYIASAMKRLVVGSTSLFDQDDGFFYDLLVMPDGQVTPFRVRSLVGLIPLFAIERLEASWIEPFKEFRSHLDWFLTNRREIASEVIHQLPSSDGSINHVLTIVDQNQLKKLLRFLADPEEFLSPYGVRSLSRYHDQHPFEFQGHRVGYEPAEAQTKIKGGNSNWRGPVWFPTSFLLVESLRKLGSAYGDQFKLDGPVGSQTLFDLAHSIARRLTAIFLLDDNNRRPVWADQSDLFSDPLWRDELLFFEYFNAETGAGLGASHQTGWTALVASLIAEWPSEP